MGPWLTTVRRRHLDDVARTMPLPIDVVVPLIAFPVNGAAVTALAMMIFFHRFVR